jgi:uncharacterized repeat protein (TIGR03803 family)
MSNRKPRPGRFAKRLALAIAFVLVATTTYSVEAQTYTEKVLYLFTGNPDGEQPQASLIQDTNGNLYGTTLRGGDPNCPSMYANACGIVFKVSANGVETILYSFPGTPDGASPQSVLVRDAKGNLYGTTIGGGEDSPCGDGPGCGTVFKLDPTGKETVLHSFPSFVGDGLWPYAGLRRDKKGNLYGTTYGGGVAACTFGCGTVFKIDRNGVYTILYSFTGTGGDGEWPSSRLIGDGAGNFYGTTVVGGLYGNGTVFKLDTATNEETVLYSFTGVFGDGKDPLAGLVRDANGNLYGTTYEGGVYNHGMVFKLDATGKETVLHSFNGKGGTTPFYGDLVLDKAGNLYGTTQNGGALNAGTVFKVSSTTGKETVLHSFKGSDGAYPWAGLVEDGKGNFYGTTTEGGDLNCNPPSGCGTVFKLTP